MKPDKPRFQARRHVRILVAGALAAAALAAAPGAGDAAVINVGSDLTKPANLVEAHGADALWWNHTVDGKFGAMPVDGQIKSVRVKGVVLDNPSLRRNPERPRSWFHVQVLHPIGGGRVRVMLTSGLFVLPIVNVARDGTAQGNTQAINTYQPVNLCVRKGDHVDFNEIGGHEWSWGGLDGMHFQIFSQTPNSSTFFYTKNAGTNNNSEWAPQALRQGQELLMQAKLATGPDATDFCPGGYMQHVFTGLGLRNPQSTTMSNGTVKVNGNCSFKIYGACKGVLLLKATVAGRVVTLGGAPFSVRRAYSSSIPVKLTQEGVALVKQAGSLTARVRADGHDDPRNDSRAKPDVPVQRKTTFATVTIRAG